MAPALQLCATRRYYLLCCRARQHIMAFCWRYERAAPVTHPAITQRLARYLAPSRCHARAKERHMLPPLRSLSMNHTRRPPHFIATPLYYARIAAMRARKMVVRWLRRAPCCAPLARALAIVCPPRSIRCRHATLSGVAGAARAAIRCCARATPARESCRAARR